MFLLVHSLAAVVVTAFGSVSWYAVSPFLAEATTGETVGIGAILVALGAAGKWIADWVVSLRKARIDDEERRDNRQIEQLKADRTQKAQEKASEIAHLEKALDRETEERRRLQTELAADRRQHATEMNEIRVQLMRSEIKANKAETWIRALEGILRDRKIEHLPYNADDEDSDDHVRMHGPTPSDN